MNEMELLALAMKDIIAAVAGIGVAISVNDGEVTDAPELLMAAESKVDAAMAMMDGIGGQAVPGSTRVKR